MASHAEAVVNQAVKALLRRDDDLARQAKEQDRYIDWLEMEIDQMALELVADRATSMADLRQVTTAMKIAHDLERVGDEATTIARRALQLGREPQLRQVEAVPPMAAQAMAMLKEALDTFVQREPDRARALIPRDKEVDAMHKALQAELVTHMSAHPEAIGRCLDLMVICKSLERIADHATNVAEMVVYQCEGRDIRHTGAKGGVAAEAPPDSFETALGPQRDGP